MLNKGYLVDKYLAISKITKIRSRVFSYIENELRRRGIEGLVVSHGNILNILYNNNGRLTMKEIGEGINRSKSTVTQLVDRLLKAGYVRKESYTGDKRYTYIILSEKGLTIKKDFQEISDDLVNIFFKGFTNDEVDSMLFLLDRVIENLN